ncbi:glycosyltransferase [Alteromonas sp. 345S023]|uniref:Glycosyltransferase n=1 Tax=Alteromonas profundi TaxID=2696062 RepID=A0A7X5LJ69_9ALTE|nr:glycosyltransferase [Alteromonas profundi]NDV89959.1 glycosyltransferase [Alteromonas profundi]
MKKVTYILKSFPVLSQTFVIDQINNLIENGYDVQIVSLFPEKIDSKLESSVAKYDLLSRTDYVCAKGSKISKIISLLNASFTCLKNIVKTRPVLELFMHLVKSGDLKSGLTIVRLYHYLKTSSSLSEQHRNGVFVAHFGQFGVITQAMIDAETLSGKLLTVFHGYEMSEYKQIEIWKDRYIQLCKGENRLLPISDFWRERLIAWGGTPEYIDVLHMGVDISSIPFTPQPLQEKVNILTVARATEKKGLSYAFKAVSLGLGFDFTYNYIGGGELEDELKEQVSYYDNVDKINFLGARSHSEVKSYLNNADIFLLPSVTDSLGDMEGIPVSLMEAMAAGILVISTRHSGIPELIEDGVTGFLAPEKDASALNRILNEVFTSDNISDIQLKARKKVEDEFNSDNLTKQLINFIEQ